MSMGISVDQKALKDFCVRHHIKSLAFFGSVLREDFRPESDVDVLVQFEEGHVPGFIRLASIEIELSSLFGGRRPDMITMKALHPRLREEILTRSKVAYAQG